MRILRSTGWLLVSLLAMHTNVSAQTKQAEAEKIRLEVLELVNLKRSIFLQAPLVMDERLNELAQQHSEQMALGIVPISHEGFKQRDSIIRVQFPKLSLVGENVAVADDAAAIVDGWWHSEGHKANMLGVFTKTGIGVAEANGQWYCTELYLQ